MVGEARRGWRAAAAAVVLIGGLTAVTTAGVTSLVATPASAAGPLCGTTGVQSVSGGTTTCTYTTVGEDTFNVPTGVSSLDITAVGADGTPGAPGGAGGDGASASATVAVPNGVTTLYAEVGTGGGSGGLAPASGAPAGDPPMCVPNRHPPAGSRPGRGIRGSSSPGAAGVGVAAAAETAST